MSREPLQVVRRPERLEGEDTRVIARFLDLTDRARVRAMVKRILRIPEAKIPELLRQTKEVFASRHRDLEEAFRENYDTIAPYFKPEASLTPERALLIGAYFTMEYSIESAALFNPSIVLHPDQSGLEDSAARFLMSLRATGEGHISSIVFRRGIIGADGAITFDPPPRYAYSAKPVPRSAFSKGEFLHMLLELGMPEELTIALLIQLPDPFTLNDVCGLADQIRQSTMASEAQRGVTAEIEWLARAQYELHYPPDCRPAEIVIFPATESERRGMEDLRLVRFTENHQRARYFGTYTAYDGQRILPMMLETSDFTEFRICTLIGKYARNKGMALFPKKVSGHYAMVARSDGVNLYLLLSDSIHEWNEGHKLLGPVEPWELTQIGNCGSPLETEAGWLLLTHGVGPIRRYCIGAVLLDRHDPLRVIGRLREPLLSPDPSEREGYVPNVLYSCGSMIHGDQLIIPYAMSDSRTGFATVSVPSLLDRLTTEGASRLARG